MKYIEKFYLLYKDKIQIFPQLVEELFSIPWGHHRYIIDKCKNVDGDFEINVRTDKGNDTVLLNTDEIALLFDRDYTTIRKHISNSLKEELDEKVVVAKFANTTKNSVINVL